MAMHRINRLEVELRSGETALARAMSERVSRMHEHHIAPVIDRVCSELGGTEALVRIDQLELDLGALTVNDFEADFVGKLEYALRAALAKALSRRAAGDHRAQASLEILETFALTGGLPWWAPQDSNVVAHHFARAVVLAETELLALLRRIAGDPGALDRIARTCDPDALVALVERTQGGQPIPRGVDPRERRMLLSRVVEQDEQIDDLHHPSPARTRTEDPPHDDSQPTMDRHLRGARRPSTSTDEEPLPADQPPRDEPPPPPPGTLAAASPVVAPISPSPIDTPGPTTSAPRLPSPPAVSVPHQSSTPPTGTETTYPLPSPSKATASSLSQRLPIPPERTTANPVHHPLDDPPAGTAALAPRRLSAPPALTPRVRAARRSALARLDELYVDDAGLVILWPFLERFFVRTGVLGEDRRFFDEAAQLQAVALLEALATADPEPLEFRLPLAKLLCGRPLESDFALERPLTPEQLAEADHLLVAVIDRAPMLGEISIPSFRAAFLARPGALGTRDGAWLLQVERQTHDVVLDRFPWSWGWIRLPWMAEPLRVEW